MKGLKILFMGASRLVGLLDRFKAAAIAEGISLEMLSLEDNSPWHAIAAAGICQIVRGPAFKSSLFEPFLQELIREEKINIVIPNIDSATVALAPLKQKFEKDNVLLVVSTEDLCEAMYDKKRAESIFRHYRINTPLGENYPLIAKPRFGSSSRGQFVFKEPDEFRFWCERNNSNDYVIQPFIKGTEYSIDAYVNNKGGILGAVSRVRVVVSGGEVMVTQTEQNEHVLGQVDRLLQVPGWYGPLTIQVINNCETAYMIECNPRFGSGSTCSIEAGLDMPRWILREYLGRTLPTTRLLWKSGLCMTRARKDYFLWLS